MSERLVKNFGIWFKNQVKAKGFRSARQFSIASGITLPTVLRLMRDVAPERVHGKTVIAIAKTLGMESDALALIIRGCLANQREKFERNKKKREGAIDGINDSPVYKDPIIEVIDPDEAEKIEATLTEPQKADLEMQMLRWAKAEEVAKERWFLAQNVHTADNGDPLDFNKYPYQIAIYQDASPYCVVGGSSQWGKAHPIDCPVLTVAGWRPIGELKPGDLAMNQDGNPVRVNWITTPRMLPMMRITFGDGRVIDACTEHLWEAAVTGEALRTKSVFTTQDLFDRMSRGASVEIPLTRPQPMFGSEPLPIDPGTLGRVLFRQRFHSESNDIQNNLDSLGAYVTPDRAFIPLRYLEANISSRKSLAEGLLCDISPGSRGIFWTPSIKLARDVCQLVWSLGGIASLSDKRIDHSECCVAFNFPISEEFATLGISRIEPIEPAEGVCIEVDDPRGLYVAKDFIVTHNSKMTVADVAANAICDVPVLYVISKIDKRDRFVGEEVDVNFQSHPYYQACIEMAKKRGADLDSKRQKGFGNTFVNFIGSNSDRDFTSLRAGKSIVDEHDDCVRTNIEKLPDRLSGYPWRFQLDVGHFTEEGGKDDRNLWWKYLQTDQRRWCIPCDKCQKFIEIEWEKHIVIVKRNEKGSIMDVKVRDPLWNNKRQMDPHPMCECGAPLNRLHKGGVWIARAPQNDRVGHGYQLSNIYNLNVPILTALARYQIARNDPSVMKEFMTKYLGLPYTAASTRITDQQILDCTREDVVPQYQLQRVQSIQWRSLS